MSNTECKISNDEMEFGVQYYCKPYALQKFPLQGAEGVDFLKLRMANKVLNSINIAAI